VSAASKADTSIDIAADISAYLSRLRSNQWIGINTCICPVFALKLLRVASLTAEGLRSKPRKTLPNALETVHQADRLLEELRCVEYRLGHSPGERDADEPPSEGQMPPFGVFGHCFLS
jgi:hypothetical protein